MRRLIALALAVLVFGAGASVASAQTPQADACYGLTLQYRVNPNPDLIRIAQDVGCLVVPAMPYGAYSVSPTYVNTVAVPVAVPYAAPVAVPYVAPVAVPVVVPVRGPHWHHHR